MASAQPHDYTTDPPFGEDSPDDFVIAGNITAATSKSADEIEKENSFTDVPPGEHLLVVAGFIGAPKAVNVRVTVNGQILAYNTHTITVRLSLPDNPKCSIADFFALPPSDPRELKAYFEGVPDGKKAAGWAASKFVHFINRLGFLWAPGQPFPDAARKLGGWKGRHVIATVEPPENYKDEKTGEMKTGRPKIKSFSYRPAAGGHAAGAPSHSGPTGGRAPSRPQPAMAGAGNGLDNI